MKQLACALALMGAFAASDALAWGNDGHKAVGAIADRLLKGSNAQKQIDQILLPGESLESVSIWPDCVKGNWCGPQTPEMLAYVAANPKHTEYHYTDVPFQLPAWHEGEVGTADDDIVHTLRQCIAALQGRTDDAANPHHFTKRQALIVLTHLAGDIHQPLHVGAAYVDKAGKFVVPTKGQLTDLTVFDSRGGNNFLLDAAKVAALEAGRIPAAEPAPVPEGAPVKEGVPQALTKPFHTYWDVTAVDYAFRRSRTRTPGQFAQAMIDKAPQVAPATGEPSSWPEQWADDSLAVAKLAFADVKPGALTKQMSKKGEVYYTWPLEVPDNYPVPSSDLARTQLTKGGYHLAQLLRAIWP